MHHGLQYKAWHGLGHIGVHTDPGLTLYMNQGLGSNLNHSQGLVVRNLGGLRQHLLLG